MSLDISVVVPLYNEEESLPELVEWIHRVMIQNGFSYEILMVDDGSYDQSWNVIQGLKSIFPTVKGYRFQRNYGKSAALHVGFQKAIGNVVITMDADMQDSPDEIPELYRMIVEEKYDLVSGYKQKRYDPITKTVPTKLFNWATRKISGIHNLHDFNCGLKSYRKDVVKSIEVYGELHRYIPFLAKEAGYKKIGEKVVVHRARKYGSSKFGLERFINGFLDLLTLSFTLKFGRAPMHFFGSFGVLSFLSGFFIVVYLIGKKLYYLQQGEVTREVIDQPLFYLSLAALIIGVQLFLTGFLGELLVRNNPSKNNYIIKETTNEIE